MIWNLDVRDLACTMRTGLRSAPYGERGWIMATEIVVAHDCTAQIYLFPDYEPIPFRVGDQFFDSQDSLQGQDGPFAVHLHAGANLVHDPRGGMAVSAL